MTTTLLENPDENPCFGCGPEHARGLRLRFEREGDAVRTTYEPKPDEIGWPGIFHTGLHFMVLFEACYWAALELTGQVHVLSRETASFQQDRLPRVGRPFTVTARIVERAGERVRVRAEGRTADGKPTAVAECWMDLAHRASIERAGVKLPEYLLADTAP